MSDHGARPMMGGFCFNDWLAREGYLALAAQPSHVMPMKDVAIDWGRTVAWGDGGYYGRLFLNVKGREPEGIVEPARYEEVRDELIAQLEAAPGPDGMPLGTKVLKPQDVYPEVRGVAPDLIVYFGDLAWRSVGSVGNRSIYTYENDTGPDGANHDRSRRVGDGRSARSDDRRGHRSQPGRRRSVHPVAVRPAGARGRRGKELPVTHHPEQKGFTVWFTGLSGAGKSTIAEMLFHEFQARGLRTEILDGDVVRQNLSKGLGFSKEDRDTNILRIGFVAELLTRNGVATICCPISPYQQTRDRVREMVGEFVEIYVFATLEELVQNRDPKGLYKKALAGEIPGFTGVDDPYEAPEHPELMLDTMVETPERSLQRTLTKLKELGYLDDDTILVEGDRLHSGLTDLRIHETGHVVNET